MTLTPTSMEGVISSRLLLWQIRIAGGFALLQFLLGSGAIRMLAAPDQHLGLAESLYISERLVGPLFLFAFATALGMLLLRKDSSRPMLWSLAALALVVALAAVATLIDPLHGALPIRNTILFDVFTLPLLTRAVITQTILLATCCVYLGLEFLRTRACPKPWALFLFGLAGWVMYAGLTRASWKAVERCLTPWMRAAGY